eukprot:5543651-Prymnesium_polylepis.1
MRLLVRRVHAHQRGARQAEVLAAHDDELPGHHPRAPRQGPRGPPPSVCTEHVSLTDCRLDWLEGGAAP